jgi:hypothetical protein
MGDLVGSVCHGVRRVLAQHGHGVWLCVIPGAMVGIL